MQDLDFEVVILDELCSILRDAFCSVTNKKQRKNFQTLKFFLQRSLKIYGTDAHLTNAEVSFMKLWLPSSEIQLVYNHFRPGKLGTPSQHAFLYPEPNHKNLEKKQPDSFWYHAVNSYVQDNKNKLTQIYISTDDDFKVIQQNLCQQPKIEQIVEHLGIEEKFVSLEILRFSGHLNPKHVATVSFTGKTTEQAKRKCKDPFENLVLRVKNTTVLLHNSALTCGCDIWISPEESTYNVSYACCSWFIDVATRVLQALCRIRNCKPGTEKEIHICTKKRRSTTGGPKQCKYPPGLKNCINYLASNVPLYLREYIDDFDKRLFRVWAKIQNQRAMFVNMTQETWEWWLRDSNYSITHVTEENFNIENESAKAVSSWKKIKKLKPRPVSSIKKIIGFEVDSHWVDEFREGKILENPRNIQIYDKTAKLQKYVYTNHLQRRKKFVGTFLVWFQRNFCKIPEVWKKINKLDDLNIERFIGIIAVPTEQVKDLCELAHEIELRTRKLSWNKLEWKQGFFLIWLKFCAEKEDQDFETFRSNWKIVQLLRLRKQGLGCKEKKNKELLKSRYNRKTLYGMLGDSKSHRLVVLSKCERETIGTCFCKRLQLTPNEYKKCLEWCKNNKPLILKTFGALPKKKQLDTEFKVNRSLFAKILKCYGLKTRVCNVKKDHPIKLNVPLQSDSIKKKKEFVEKIKCDYPELYMNCWKASMGSVKLFPKTFKRQNFKKNNISLISIFVRRNQEPFRLYWKLKSPNET